MTPHQPTPLSKRKKGNRTPRASSSISNSALVLQAERYIEFESQVDSAIPSALKLQAVNEVVPGFAKQFTDGFLSEGKTRRFVSVFNTIGDMLRSYAALGTAAGITVYFAHLSFLAIMADHDLAGGALGTVDIAALASTFIIGSHGCLQRKVILRLNLNHQAMRMRRIL